MVWRKPVTLLAHVSGECDGGAGGGSGDLESALHLHSGDEAIEHELGSAVGSDGGGRGGQLSHLANPYARGGSGGKARAPGPHYHGKQVIGLHDCVRRSQGFGGRVGLARPRLNAGNGMQGVHLRCEELGLPE